MPGDLRIDSFRPGEEGDVIGVILPIQREEFGFDITADDQPDLHDIPGFYQQGSGEFWLARVDGAVVGTIALKDIGNGEAALRKMFVHADHRGTPPGVAAALLRTLLHAAAQRGVQRIYLGTTDRFRAAHRFYEKHGFKLIASETLPASFPRMAVDTRFYVIDLATQGH